MQGMGDWTSGSKQRVDFLDSVEVDEELEGDEEEVTEVVSVIELDVVVSKIVDGKLKT